MKRSLEVVALLLLVAQAAAAESFIASLGASGIVKGDLASVLYLNDIPISDPGWTLTEQPNGRDYTFAALPDVAAGEGDAYTLCWSHLGQPACYSWPDETRTPQAVVWQSRFTPTPAVLQIGAGDTAVPAQLVVEGLASDPAGSVVTFTMRRESGGAAVVDGSAAVLADVDAVVDPATFETTWTATVIYAWSADDTSTAGTYRAWFTITFPGGGVMTAPPQRNLPVRIF